MELDEFAEALLDQLSVETAEEKEIERLGEDIATDKTFDVSFEPLDALATRLMPEMSKRAESFTGLSAPDGLHAEIAELDAFKALKAKKVHVEGETRAYVDDLFAAVATADVPAISSLAERDTAKFLVYSMYAKSYLSRISTTYGDYADHTVYLNSFILSRYPQIILYKQGAPYTAQYDTIKSGYAGAVKMAVLEEIMHSMQPDMFEASRKSAILVNACNEKLARAIMSLDNAASAALSEHMSLQQVPDDFAVARRANLFFALSPETFIAHTLGQDVMTYTNISVDQTIRDAVPDIVSIYESWLVPFQAHHAAISVIEGIAGFVVKNVLSNDADFQTYLRAFMQTDSYVSRSAAAGFVSDVHAKVGTPAFAEIMRRAPSARELRDSASWMDAS